MLLPSINVTVAHWLKAAHHLVHPLLRKGEQTTTRAVSIVISCPTSATKSRKGMNGSKFRTIESCVRCFGVKALL
jgi:hypothetical protein